MRKRGVWFFLALAGLFLVTANAARAQNAATRASVDEHARRSVAVNTLRAINTAQYAYKSRHGTFASWDVLIVSGEFSERPMHFAVQNEPQLASVHFLKAPQILPGWTLRLNVTPDGKGYDILLEDQTDKTCGYAAITDERGLIRESKVIDCDI